MTDQQRPQKSSAARLDAPQFFVMPPLTADDVYGIYGPEGIIETASTMADAIRILEFVKRSELYIPD